MTDQHKRPIDAHEYCDTRWGCGRPGCPYNLPCDDPLHGPVAVPRRCPTCGGPILSMEVPK